MKKILSILSIAMLLFMTACNAGLVVSNSDAADASRAVAKGSNGEITVNNMNNGSMSVSYNAGSQLNYARLFVSEGNGAGLVLANADMQYSGGTYTYTLNHGTFTNGAKIYVCVLTNNGSGEKCVPQGTLANTTSWAQITYGDNSGSSSSSSGSSAPVTGSIENGTYKIIAKCSGKSIDVAEWSTTAGTNIHQWAYGDNQANQQWILTSTGDGYYTIVSKHSGFCLDVQDWSTATGANVLQWHNNAQANQKWSFERLDDGYYKITNQHSGKVLDVSNSSPDDGANIQQWDWNSSDAQRWQLTKLDGSSNNNTGSNNPPVGGSTGNGSSNNTGATGLYRDNSLTYATWSDLSAGTIADFAVGEWEGTSFGVNNGVATITVGDGYWHGATVAQVPPQASSSSYYNFANVAYMKFYVQSSNISASDVQLIMQNSASANVINSVPLTSYGVNSITNWTEVTVPVSAYRGEKIKTAIAFSVGNTVGTSLNIKQIGFLDANGNNVDVTTTLSWPITNASGIKNGMRLAWSDEFNGSSTTPNPSIWTYDTVDTVGWGWGNGELQTYTDSRTNSYVSNGTLKIAAVKDGNGNWTSGRLKTKGLKDFTYGYVEFRAKVADGVGLWPALWMLPTDLAYGTWPASGEIDVMEFTKNLWGTTIYGTLHCSAGSGGNPIHTAGKDVPTAGSEWHTYAVHWTPTAITWYFDDALMSSYSNPGTGTAAWPYDQRFHIIMNVAVGGNLGGAVDPNLTSDYMEVDYVRVYQ